MVVVQLLGHVWLFKTPNTAARQTPLSFTISQSYSNSCPLSQWCYLTCLILCFLLLLPSIFASTRVFSNEWALHNVLNFTELVYSKSGIISRQTDSRAQALNSFLTLSPLVERLGMLWPGWRLYDNWPFGCFWIIFMLQISILICFVHWTQTLC